MWYGCGNTGMSNPSEVKVTLSGEGRITLYNGAVDIGQGSDTIMRQICADALGVSIDQIAQITGDTDLTPDAGKTSASRQTYVTGKATELAAQDLRKKIIRLANAAEDAPIEIRDGQFVVGETAISLSRLKMGTNGVVLTGVGNFDPPATPLDENGQGEPYGTYAFAAQLAVVLSLIHI